jgi:Na+/H+-dicarboxylate symporter
MAYNSRRMTQSILIAMIFGICCGSILNELTSTWELLSKSSVDIFLYWTIFPIGHVFIRLINMMIIPIVFCSLIQGVTQLNDIRLFGTLGIRTFALYMLTTVIAISIGLLLAISFNIGQNFSSMAISSTPTIQHHLSITSFIDHFIPKNIIFALANNKLLQVIVFSILFSLAALNSAEAGKSITRGISNLNTVVINLTMMILKLTPIGVFCLISKTFYSHGIQSILPLTEYFFTVVLALVLHLFITYGSLLHIFSKTNILKFINKIAPALLFAFSTSSSSASIPMTIKVIQEKLNISSTVSSFVIPLGATINMDGTAIMQGVATVFLANVFNIDISFSGYLIIIAMATLASIGAAGVPSAGLITLAMVLQQVGIDEEAIGLIWGVDRILDMMRTAINITGDSTVAVIIEKTCLPKLSPSPSKTIS